jgi:hypothetical protein
LAERRIETVIPSTATRNTPYPLNGRAYHRHDRIERLFCLSETGDGSLPRNYLAGLTLAAIISDLHAAGQLPVAR